MASASASACGWPAAGKRIVDTTCPLVLKAHAAAQELAREGRRVIVLGRRQHVEVRGVVEDLERAIVIEDPSQVRSWPDRRLGVVCQTTLSSSSVDRLLAAIRAANPIADVRFLDTVCNPTKARGAAVEALLRQVDALVVVGGRTSNNTRQLALRGRRAGLPTLHIESDSELDADWFRGHRSVGLTAGTSTLPATVDAVYERLRTIASGMADASSGI